VNQFLLVVSRISVVLELLVVVKTIGRSSNVLVYTLLVTVLCSIVHFDLQFWEVPSLNISQVTTYHKVLSRRITAITASFKSFPTHRS